MAISLSLDDLLEYTEWQRQQWNASLKKSGDEVLKISAGPHGDGRFRTVGELVRHIFSAEKRYVERLSEQPLSDTSSLPHDNIEALFQFGNQSRKRLKEFLNTFPADQWDVPREFKLMSSVLTLTPRKVIIHVLLHEIRHWAQIATLLRLNGMQTEFQDFLFSPVMAVDVAPERAGNR